MDTASILEELRAELQESPPYGPVILEANLRALRIFLEAKGALRPPSLYIPRRLEPREISFLLQEVPPLAPENDKIYQVFLQDMERNLSRLVAQVTPLRFQQWAQILRKSQIPTHLQPRARPPPQELRNLTPEEIETIVEVIPGPPTPDLMTRDMARQLAQQAARRDLQRVKFVVGPGTLESIRDRTRERYAKSIAESGYTAGYHADNGFMQFIFQASMDTFRATTASTVGSGANLITNLLYTKQDRDDKAMSLHFREDFPGVTEEDVQDVRSHMVSVTLRDFIPRQGKGYRIEIGVFTRPGYYDKLRLERSHAYPSFTSHSGYAGLESYPLYVIRGARTPQTDLAQVRAAVEGVTGRAFDLVEGEYDVDWVTRELVLEVDSEMEQVREKMEEAGILHPRIGVLFRAEAVDSIRKEAAAKFGQEIPASWWYDVYEALKSERENTNYTINYSPFAMRIHFDTQMLFDHKLRPQDIATFMAAPFVNKDQYKDTELADIIDQWIDVVPAPFEEGYVDVIAKRTDPNSEDARRRMEDALLIFFNRVLGPRLGQVHIKGIPGIKAVSSHAVSYADLFKSYTRLGVSARRPDVAVWRVELDTGAMFSHAVTQRFVARFFDQFPGVKLERWVLNPDYELAERIIRERGLDVSRLRKQHSALLLSAPADVSDLKSWMETQNPPVTRYVYAISDGSNLREIIKLPWIDDSRTMTNDIHQAVDVFGVEAALNYYLYEFNQCMHQAGNRTTDPHNIILLGDFIFGWGLALGVKPNSMAQRETGFLSRAFISSYGSVMREGAVTQSIEPHTSIVGSMFMGREFPSGKYTYEIDTAQESLDFIKQELAYQKQIMAYRANPHKFPRLTRYPAPVLSEEETPFAIVKIAAVAPSSGFSRYELGGRAWEAQDDEEDPGEPLTLERGFAYPQAALPSWIREASRLYEPRIQALWEEDPVPPHIQVVEVVSPLPETPTFTYARSSFNGLYREGWERQLQSVGFHVVEAKYPYVDFLELGLAMESKAPERELLARVKGLLVNKLQKTRSVTDKGRLYASMHRVCPEVARDHMVEVLSYENFIRGEPQLPQVLILRPTGTGAHSGRGVVVVEAQTLDQVTRERDRIRNLFGRDPRSLGRILVSPYLTTPLLWKGDLKFDIRMHLVHFVPSSGPKMTRLGKLGWISAASQPFVAGEYDNPEIHDVHFNSLPSATFPESFAEIFGERMTQYVAGQIAKIGACVGKILGETTLTYPNFQNGYEIFGLDFMVDSQYQVYLVEVNARPSLLNWTQNQPFDVEFGPWTPAQRAISEDIYRAVYEFVDQVFLKQTQKDEDLDLDQIISEVTLTNQLTSAKIQMLDMTAGYPRLKSVNIPAVRSHLELWNSGAAHPSSSR